ncbi:hypothetical protein IQ264_20330 [Phormidium sp. LEGE 05292]|uniref:hypothetical protein n=1 Tax=[Phormidium] sp. LEGE 05292 TaxID=767427 RepID=UPI001882BAD7|nr:hypothetical protein [Phormidium sp. LEGE 05292]MBE9227776.1 hypothetical protein [Phormidium sp. LEGE 05292]
MKIQTIALASILSLTSLSIAIAAKADTVQARCDVYPKGEDRATSSGPCTFSQRQGFVSIQLENGRRYELRPVGNQPGNYQDQNGQRAYRQSGLGEAGQIFRLANQSIYVYWDTASGNDNQSNSSTSSSSSPTPVTVITRKTPNEITVRITEGEFKYSGVLRRTSGNTFIGSDGRVRVIYDRNTKRITVINAVTGDEFYNYIYSDVDEGRL